jgi:cellulose synthase/poly-beta-1,6-N-acetylglucosamine synthase-like glycosyltransferase
LLLSAGTNMGLRLSMLHNHSRTHDRDDNQAVKPFVAGQGIPSARYETAMQGPFPVYSVTEDYALSLELKKAGVKVRQC